MVIECTSDHVAIVIVTNSAYQSIFEVLNCVHCTDQLLIKFVDSLLESKCLSCTSTCDTHFIEPELEVIHLALC